MNGAKRNRNRKQDKKDQKLKSHDPRSGSGKKTYLNVEIIVKRANQAKSTRGTPAQPQPTDNR